METLESNQEGSVVSMRRRQKKDEGKEKAKELFSRLKKDDVKFVKLQFTDMMGMVKSVDMPADKLTGSLKDGTWFDGSSIEGFARIHESDMILRPDAGTYAVLPWLKASEGNTARLICDVHAPGGEPYEGDPRTILKNVLAEAEAMGFEYKVGPELEFFLFRKENGELKPLPHDKGGYFDLTTDQAADIRRRMVVALQRFGIDVEAFHHEVAKGQHEIDFRYANALQAADNGTTLRFVLKAIAQQHDLHATFMPKPIPGENGSGMHVHQSLFRNGRNAFFSKKDRYNLSGTAYAFIAGQLEHIKEMCALLSPTVNSYKRLVPGYEAPVYISWARVNRSALIRVPHISPDKPNSARAELRSPDPTANLYLAFAAMLKAGLDGIRRKLEAPSPVEEDLFHFDEPKLAERRIDTLPSSLGEALARMKASGLMKDALGEHTFRRYIEAKQSEWDSYRLSVSQWELDRYLERY